MVSEIIGYKPLKIRPRTDVDELSLRKEIFQKGLAVTWHRGTPCPCSRTLDYGNKQADTSEPDPDCSLCKGTGIYYYTSQDIQAVVLSQKNAPERFAHYGERAIGAARFTVLPEHTPGWLDKFVVKDSYIEYRELRTRRATVEELRYPIKTRPIVTGTSGQAHVQTTVNSAVVFCIRGKLDNTVSTTELVQTTHFNITSDGKIDWTPSESLSTPAFGFVDIDANLLSVGDGFTITIAKLAGGTGVATSVIAAPSGSGYPTTSGAKSFEISPTSGQTTGNNLAAAIENAISGVTSDVVQHSGTTARVRIQHTQKGDYGNSSTIAVANNVGGGSSVVGAGFQSGANVAPIVGEKYAICYYVNPTYIVKSFPYSLRTTFVNKKSPSDPTRTELPVRADCWLEWLGD